MDWAQVLFLFFANTSIVLWMRSESRSDWRHMDNKFDEHMKEVNGLIKAIQEESKDFHARLCAIEERNKEGRK